MLPLLLALVAIRSAEALTCYDCLSLALSECSTSSLRNEFDQTNCKPDENYCAVLYLNDSAGQQVVSRQCASRKDEGEQLKSFIEGTQKKPLKLVHFETCGGNLCNGVDLRDASAVNEQAPTVSSVHGGGGKKENGSGGSSGVLPSALALALPLALTVARRRQ